MLEYYEFALKAELASEHLIINFQTHHRNVTSCIVKFKKTNLTKNYGVILFYYCW